MTEEQVAIAIAVLRAYVDGTLRTDLCDELDEALTKAYQEWELNNPRDDDYSNFGDE